jgi:UDP-glucose 4-epimerase
MRALVTGANGFIGSAVVRELSENGHFVTALVRGAEALRPSSPQMRWAQADLRQPVDWRQLLNDVDCVFHLAWTTLPGPSNLDPIADASDNILSALRLMEAIKDRRDIRLVFASSGGTVYGRLDVVPADEGHPLRPTCAYGVSKLSVERYLLLYQQLWGLNSVSLRLSNPFGAGQARGRNFGAVTSFVECALKNRPIRIFGDGSVVRDFIHVTDAARAIVAAGLTLNTSSILNIGSGAGHSLLDVIQMIEDITKRPVQRFHEPARGFDVPVSVLNIALARKELGWAPRMSFRAGVESLIGTMTNLGPGERPLHEPVGTVPAKP